MKVCTILAMASLDVRFGTTSYGRYLGKVHHFLYFLASHGVVKVKSQKDYSFGGSI